MGRERERLERDVAVFLRWSGLPFGKGIAERHGDDATGLRRFNHIGDHGLGGGGIGRGELLPVFLSKLSGGLFGIVGFGNFAFI